MAEPLVRVERVVKVFESGGTLWKRPGLRAVDEVSLDLQAGETLGVVGESGSGKSTLLRLVLGLIRPTSGRVLIEGRDIARLDRRALRAQRRRMQAVFQDTGGAFNPRHSVLRAVMAPLEVHGIGDRRSRPRIAGEMLELCGLRPPFFHRYPHQLSGGQRQRVAIARAIVLRPALLLADEPTSALDVSVQAQILNLFKRTRAELGLTCMFVSHNLGVIRYISERVAVMHRGRIVEEGEASRLFASPQHPYTRALLDAVPEIGRPCGGQRPP